MATANSGFNPVYLITIRYILPPYLTPASKKLTMKKFNKKVLISPPPVTDIVIDVTKPEQLNQGLNILFSRRKYIKQNVY